MCLSGLFLCCKSPLGVGEVSGEPSSPASSETVECCSVTRGDAVRGDAVRGGEPCVGTHRGGGVWHAFMAPRERFALAASTAPPVTQQPNFDVAARFVPDNSKRSTAH